MLQHSLTGQLIGSVRDASLIEEGTIRPFESSGITINADRGRIKVDPISLTGKGFDGELAGTYDLLGQDERQLLLEVAEREDPSSPPLAQCELIHFDLVDSTKTTSLEPCIRQ
jgi:hypothetical protein